MGNWRLTITERKRILVEYYKRRYRAASKGNYDIYMVFVEQGLALLNPRGRLDYILPHKFCNAQYGQPLRSLLAEEQHLALVAHFGDQQVFADATTYNCLLFLDKEAASCRSTGSCFFVPYSFRIDLVATGGLEPPT